MTKYEKLGQLIGMDEDVVKQVIDDGIIDILIELNRKGYRTLYSCEGHVGFNVEAVRKPENYWQGYLGFARAYKFPIYPPKYSKVSKDKMYFYWEGLGEESRQEFLARIYDWARCLPTRPKTPTVYYILDVRSKKQPNREPKTIIRTKDYEEIKLALASADMDKYFDVSMYENFIEDEDY